MVGDLVMSRDETIEVLRTQIWQKYGSKLEQGATSSSPAPASLILRQRDNAGELNGETMGVWDFRQIFSSWCKLEQTRAREAIHSPRL